MKIQTRLLVITLSIALVTALVSLSLATYLTRNILQIDDTRLLNAVLEARYNTLHEHLEMTQRTLRVSVTAPTVIKQLRELTIAYAELGNDAQTLLQQSYTAQTENLSDALTKSNYAKTHAESLPFFQHRSQLFDWEDAFLIDPHGNIVFSTKHHSDFATNLVTGPWKDSVLAQTVKPLLQQAIPEAVSVSDFAHYPPAGNKPASFIAMPIFDTNKHVFLGVLAIQIPLEPINQIMHNKIGLGETGETILLNQDSFMLSTSRFGATESNILTKKINNIATTKLQQGQSGIEIVDEQGEEQFIAFKPFKPFQNATVIVKPPSWGIIASINKDELYQDYYVLRQNLLVSSTLLTCIAFIVGLLGARSISHPLLRIQNALSQLAQGKLAEIPYLQRTDEIGEMAKAAETFRNVTQKVEIEHWIGENVTSLANAVSSESSIQNATDNLLHLLCDKLDVPVGAIYLKKDHHYQRVGAHGLARRSQSADTFALGEGLVGQCAKDHQAIVLSPVPAGLSIISTGLAEFPPNELILYPIAHKKDVLAVLELATTKSLTPQQHDMLKSAASTLGLHLSNLQASEHNLELLEETRKQSLILQQQQEALLRSNQEMQSLTEELRSQAEEMKQQNEELKASQEELRSQAEENKAQNEELKASQEELRAQQEETQHKNQILETQRTQIETALSEIKNKADDLQRANQYKSEFLANMSHELRTPLNSVLILSRDLAENHEQNLSPEQVESASVIAESGTQLLTLINDILDLSKIEAGKLELLVEPFQLDDMLAYLRRIFAPQAEKKHLEFNIQIADDLPETLHTDKQRLTQVLTNLLSNAIKFTDSGYVRLYVSKQQQQLQLEITDSGIGIPSDKLEHIFGAFQQIDGSTSRKYGGSGLGLAISRHLINLLDGDIQVSSTLGQGSRFIVHLNNPFAPIATLPPPPPTEQKVPTATPDPTLNSARILVIEDDSRLLAILGRMINALGFNACCAESAEKALELIAQQMPDGILLDVGLPKMSGLELLRHLKQQASTSHIPVFIMSGAVDKGEAKTLGALGYLNKPVTRDTISAAIRSMIQHTDLIKEKKILVINKHAQDIDMMRALLADDHLNIVSTGNGSQALQLLRSQQFDTVILDMQLQDMNGFDWLQQASQYINPPPVIIYSASEFSESEIFKLKETTESIISKSSSNQRLRDEVLHALNLSTHEIKLRHALSSSQTGQRLLLVDDDARNLFALTKVLRNKGYQVDVAPDATQALHMLAQNHFDAILTDIMMPNIDGYALIRQIRNLGDHNIPIIAITAKAMQGDDVLCMQAGASGYFAKPVEVDKLITLLQQLCNKH